VHLALQGVDFERSPYVTGDTEGFFRDKCSWYNKCDMQWTVGEVFAEFAERSNNIRRAYGLAKYLREAGLELDPEEALQPGDLVFFRAPASVVREYRNYGAYLEISHVGIVAEDTKLMINATGRSDPRYNAEHTPVRLTEINKKGKPCIAARLG
jgi:cell wall-associated NlpC family hydrolase